MRTMAASQRVSRGLHRLALFLTAITLVVGGIASLYLASDVADSAKHRHDEQAIFICAREAIYRKFYADLSRDEFDRRLATKSKFNLTGPDFDLKELGCSDESRTVSWREIAAARTAGEV
jgi:hypothetical protein